MLVVMAVAVVVAACSSSDDSGSETTVAQASDVDGGSREIGGGDGEFRPVVEDGVVVSAQVAGFDAKIIRDGSVELRIEAGAFGASASQLRTIAADLGGYVASGETHIEDVDESHYAVGWYTIKVPSDRFDDAVDRVEQLGERVSASLTSDDVTEEYVDLEGRLGYWREQEAFYRRLMSEATEIDDLVTLQTRMQDVLLNIEQIEGRLRYLDSRTDFASLTVGLTEVPAGDLVPPAESSEPGPIAEAFDQAGEVLLATVAALIVMAAVALPLALVALFGLAIFKFVVHVGRRQKPAEG